MGLAAPAESARRVRILPCYEAGGGVGPGGGPPGVGGPGGGGVYEKRLESDGRPPTPDPLLPGPPACADNPPAPSGPSATENPPNVFPAPERPPPLAGPTPPLAHPPAVEAPVPGLLPPQPNSLPRLFMSSLHPLGSYELAPDMLLLPPNEPRAAYECRPPRVGGTESFRWDDADAEEYPVDGRAYGW